MPRHDRQIPLRNPQLLRQNLQNRLIGPPAFRRLRHLDLERIPKRPNDLRARRIRDNFDLEKQGITFLNQIHPPSVPAKTQNANPPTKHNLRPGKSPLRVGAL